MGEGGLGGRWEKGCGREGEEGFSVLGIFSFCQPLSKLKNTF